MSTGLKLGKTLRDEFKGGWNHMNFFGWKCEKWTYADEAEWCFVGYDSSCADRKLYTDPNPIDRHSQFISKIPCLEHSGGLRHAERLCRLYRICFILLLIPMLFGQLPMVAIVYLFLRNRCGDLVALNRQFAVEFSDTESSEGDLTFTEASDAGSSAVWGQRSSSSVAVKGTTFAWDKACGSSNSLAPSGSSNSLAGKAQQQGDKSFTWGSDDEALPEDDEEEEEDCSSKLAHGIDVELQRVHSSSSQVVEVPPAITLDPIAEVSRVSHVSRPDDTQGKPFSCPISSAISQQHDTSGNPFPFVMSKNSLRQDDSKGNPFSFSTSEMPLRVVEANEGNPFSRPTSMCAQEQEDNTDSIPSSNPAEAGPSQRTAATAGNPFPLV